MALNVVKATVFDLGRREGFSRKTNTLWLEQTETIGVLNLQRSEYGPLYYLNVALWLRPLGPDTRPAEVDCHIRSRVGELTELNKSDSSAFNLELEMDHDARVAALESCLGEAIGVIRACDRIVGLLSPPGSRALDQAIWASAEARELIRLSATRTPD